MLFRKYKTAVIALFCILLGVVLTLVIAPLFQLQEPQLTKAEREVLFWYDPMFPATKFDKPGPSPFMDMDLVPKYADEGGADINGVTISPTQVQNLGLKTDIAEMGTLKYTQTLPANIDFNQYQYEMVNARASGFVEKTYAVTVGDYIQKGQPLIDMTISDWVAAQSEYLTLLDSKASPALLYGVRERLYLQGMPKTLINQLDKTRKMQTYFTVLAPISGVVTDFNMRSGMTINKSDAIATIQGIDPVWITASVPESLTSLLNENTQLTVEVPALPKQHFIISEWKLLASAEASSRTLTLRLLVDNPKQVLRPGMSATVLLKTASEPYLLIPSQAVINTGLEQRVITQDQDGYFIPKVIKIYAETAGKTAILSGLTPGEKVVTSGLFLIDSEANINGALDRMRVTATDTTMPQQHSNVHDMPNHQEVK